MSITSRMLGYNACMRPASIPGFGWPAHARGRLLPSWMRRPRGRILAIKWGLNPNSSSLGVDVTFLLFGAAALSMATPVISALLRLRRPAMDPHPGLHGNHDGDRQ